MNKTKYDTEWCDNLLRNSRDMFIFFVFIVFGVEGIVEVQTRKGVEEDLDTLWCNLIL